MGKGHLPIHLDTTEFLMITDAYAHDMITVLLGLMESSSQCL